MKMYQRIRYYVDAKGMKINILAKNIGMSEKKLYRILGGSTTLSVDDYETICREGLSVDPALFFRKTFSKTEKVATSA